MDERMLPLDQRPGSQPDAAQRRDMALFKVGMLADSVGMGGELDSGKRQKLDRNKA